MLENYSFFESSSQKVYHTYHTHTQPLPSSSRHHPFETHVCGQPLSGYYSLSPWLQREREDIDCFQKPQWNTDLNELALAISRLCFYGSAIVLEGPAEWTTTTVAPVWQCGLHWLVQFSFHCIYKVWIHACTWSSGHLAWVWEVELLVKWDVAMWGFVVIVTKLSAIEVLSMLLRSKMTSSQSWRLEEGKEMLKPNPGNRNQNQATDVLENKLWDQTKSSFMSAVMENCHRSPPHGLHKMHSNVNGTSKAMCLEKSLQRETWMNQDGREKLKLFLWGSLHLKTIK